MKAPLSWINQYTDISDITAKKYADALTMSGSKVEAYEITGQEINGVVVGLIKKITPHPDAEKLRVCEVDVGSTITIVTNATNVKEGDKVPVALDGATLNGGIKIKDTKLRGVLSNGMFCSHEELKISVESYAGAKEDCVLIVQEDVEVGTDIKQVVGLGQTIVEFEITSNRSDCFSIIGLAKESAITFDRAFNVQTDKLIDGTQISDMLSISVDETKLCPRYMGAMVKNVKVGESPTWLKRRLIACGISPINNIVDITNYVLLEYGQPMHAFDYDLLKTKKIGVRLAKDGEKLMTLDGVIRELSSKNLVITDGNRPVALAGVMGGEDTKINDSTKTIVFECANFFPNTVRQTSKEFALRSESSHRYEKGLDANILPDALARALKLIQDLDAGDVIAGYIDVDNKVDSRSTIEFDMEKINKFLGATIDEQFARNILTRLGFEVDKNSVKAPSNRADIECFADVAEEVARFFGYNNIKTTLLNGETKGGGRTPKQNLILDTRNILSMCGLFEAVTYSFISPKLYNLLEIPQGDKLRDNVVITNPLGEDTSVMRSTMAGSILKALSRNNSFSNQSVGIFEIGKTYIPIGEKLPLEQEYIAIGAYDIGDYFKIKGIVETLFDKLNVKNVIFERESEKVYMHPGICAKIVIDGEYGGYIGKIHPKIAKNFELSEQTFIAEISIDTILKNVDIEKKYIPLPKYPGATRDIAIIVDKNVTHQQIVDIITNCVGDICENIALFDVYEGEQVEEGKKSMAYRIAMRSDDATLVDETINAVMKNVLDELSKKLNAKLR